MDYSNFTLESALNILDLENIDPTLESSNPDMTFEDAIEACHDCLREIQSMENAFFTLEAAKKMKKKTAKMVAKKPIKKVVAKKATTEDDTVPVGQNGVGTGQTTPNQSPVEGTQAATDATTTTTVEIGAEVPADDTSVIGTEGVDFIGVWDDPAITALEAEQNKILAGIGEFFKKMWGAIVKFFDSIFNWFAEIGPKADEKFFKDNEKDITAGMATAKASIFPWNNSKALALVSSIKERFQEIEKGIGDTQQTGGVAVSSADVKKKLYQDLCGAEEPKAVEKDVKDLGVDTIRKTIGIEPLKQWKAAKASAQSKVKEWEKKFSNPSTAKLTARAAYSQIAATWSVFIKLRSDCVKAMKAAASAGKKAGETK